MSVNRVHLIGKIGRDPDSRFSKDGKAITKISVATSETWKDKSGDKQSKTEWHRVIFFGRQAEVANEYLKKGSKLYVEGRLQTSKWQDKDGQDRYTTEIIASNMTMLDSKQGGGKQQQQDFGDQPLKDAPPPSDDFDDQEIPF